MDVDVYAMAVILAIALAIIAMVQPFGYNGPSLSAIYRYWPQYYNFTVSGDVNKLFFVKYMTCWIYNGSWTQISNAGGLGLATHVANLICR